MPRLALAAALLLTPALAHAQQSVSYSGCSIYSCTVLEGTLVRGTGSYASYYDLFATVSSTPQPALLNGPLTLVASAFAGFNFFDTPGYGDFFEDVGVYQRPYSPIGPISYRYDVYNIPFEPTFNGGSFGATYTSSDISSLRVNDDYALGTVPEPEPLALTLGGLAVVGAVAWRRRARTA